MVVERVSFPGGLPFKKGEDPKDTVVGAMLERKGVLTSLAAGEYDLTPREWAHNKFTYNLIVNPDGTGVCRVMPLYPDSAMMEIDGSDLRVGGRQVPIAKGSPSMIIAGPNEEGIPAVYECLIYNAGKSPRA